MQRRFTCSVHGRTSASRSTKPTRLPGGSLRTVEVDGFRFEAGGNGFLTNKPDCLQLVQDAGGAHLLLPSSDLARKRFIYDGQLQRMPESPPLLARSKLMTWPQKLRMLGEIFVPARRDDVDESLREFGNRRLGAGFTNVFLDAMSAGIYGSTPDKISVRAAFPLIVALEREHGGLFRGMFARRKKRAGPGGVLTSTVRGISSMTGHLRDVIAAEWHFEEPVRAVARHDRGYRVQSALGTRGLRPGGRLLAVLHCRRHYCTVWTTSSRSSSAPSSIRRSPWWG